MELEWIEADAEALPFANGECDVVTSSFGAIFAPDHRAVAEEMLRVCRLGGTIGPGTAGSEQAAVCVFAVWRSLSRSLRGRIAGRDAAISW